MLWPFLTFAMLVAVVVLTMLLAKSKKNQQAIQNDLLRFQNIVDIEKEVLNIRQASQKEAAQSKSQVDQYQKDAEKKIIKSQQDSQKEATQIKADADQYRKSADKEIENSCQLAEEKIKTSQKLITQQKIDSEKNLKDLRKKTTKARKDYKNKQSKLAVLSRQVIDQEEVLNLEMSGFYQPQYNLLDVARFAQELKRIRAELKLIIKNKNAIICNTEWEVGGSAAQGRKMIDRIIKLGLSAFNTQVDNTILKVTVKNISTSETKIRKIRTNIDKLLEPNHCVIQDPYLELKIQELKLAFEFAEKKERDKEEERLIREQMKEDKKLEREAETELKKIAKETARQEKELVKARLDAEKQAEEQQKILQQELAAIEANVAAGAERDRMRAELEERFAHERTKFEGLLQEKEAQLEEAQRNQIAISQARLTRRGFVYIISNIGSFGPDVYKIGMSRRLDPTVRVKELGSASVPFHFDTHAMIFSEDAPTLEKTLHERFSEHRVNMVNTRKEFFKVSIDSIEHAVHELCGDDVEFIKTPDAKEFRLSQAPA